MNCDVVIMRKIVLLAGCGVLFDILFVCGTDFDEIKMGIRLCCHRLDETGIGTWPSYVLCMCGRIASIFLR